LVEGQKNDRKTEGWACAQCALRNSKDDRFYDDHPRREDDQEEGQDEDSVERYDEED